MKTIINGGFVVARQLTKKYCENPNVKAVWVGGSVARGCADQYSDLEIVVYWSFPPTDKERIAIVEQIGGDLWYLASYSIDPEQAVNEHYGLKSIEIEGQTHQGTAMIDAKHVTLSDLKRCFHDVQESYDTDIEKQILISSVRDGIPLYGELSIKEWKLRSLQYPKPLAIKMIQEHLFNDNWFIPQSYIERNDSLAFYTQVLWMQQSILRSLAGLNHCYLHSADNKWMDWLINRFFLAPSNLSARFKNVFRISPTEGLQHMFEILHETIVLVSRNVSEVHRNIILADRPQITDSWMERHWNHPKPYTLFRDIGHL